MRRAGAVGNRVFALLGLYRPGGAAARPLSRRPLAHHPIERGADRSGLGISGGEHVESMGIHRGGQSPNRFAVGLLFTANKI